MAAPPCGVRTISTEGCRTGHQVADCATVTPRLLALGSTSRAEFVVASSISSSDTEVYLVIGALAAVGGALLVLAGWLLKATRPERELLGPLERMGERSWRDLDPAMQRRELDELRPPGARPVRGSRPPSRVDADEGLEHPGQDDDTAEAAAPEAEWYERGSDGEHGGDGAVDDASDGADDEHGTDEHGSDDGAVDDAVEAADGHTNTDVEQTADPARP